MFREDVDPVVLAQYLLSFAITARQVPEHSIVLSLEQKGEPLESHFWQIARLRKALTLG